ncbi:MAG: hypothetical protein GXP47_08990 [Acidobacteria bacterium]|nr:hypothetical protein [Acidobacteriota bacterium]
MTGSSKGDAVLERLLSMVEQELETLFGQDGFYRWGERAFMRVEDGAVLFLVVTPLGDDALLNVRCYLVREVERPDAELGDYLAHLNADQIFGGFSIDEDSDVCYDYTVLGSSVTAEVIALAIEVVAHAAVQYAPEIISRWGGVSSLDKLRQELDSEGEPPGDEGDGPLN